VASVTADSVTNGNLKAVLLINHKMGLPVWLRAVLGFAAVVAVTSQQDGTSAVSLNFTGSSTGDCSATLGSTSCSISGDVKASVAAPTGPVLFTTNSPSSSLQLTRVTPGSSAGK
jgi:hypothetical protein